MTVLKDPRNPQGAENRLRQSRKASVLISGSFSKCTALTTQHVYRHTHLSLTRHIACLNIEESGKIHTSKRQAHPGLRTEKRGGDGRRYSLPSNLSQSVLLLVSILNGVSCGGE